MELLLFVALQASDKTSFYVERFLNTHARVSRYAGFGFDVEEWHHEVR